jgi:hypothetical protein
MLVVQLNECLFLLVEGKLGERFDYGTQCNLSCHFDNLVLFGSYVIRPPTRGREFPVKRKLSQATLQSNDERFPPLHQNTVDSLL